MLTLIEVKDWLRLEQEDTAEDALLQSLIMAVEEYLRNALSSWVDPSTNPMAKILVMTLIADMYENREAVDPDPRMAAQKAGYRPTIRALMAQLQYAYPAILTAALPDTTVGVSYSALLKADGGERPYSWAIITGSLPDGLTLDERIGEISGITSTAGTFVFTAQLTDSSPTPKVVSRPIKITVVNAL